MDLKCRKTECVFNDRYACTARHILVGKETDCTTYKKDKNKTPANLQDVSKTMFEAVPELAPYRHNKKCHIACNAECLFNRENKCHANGITVLEVKQDAICGTFIEK